jgi:hypothetical protein
MSKTMRLDGPKFAHRPKADGGYDAICTTCVATVASAQTEEDLAAFESAHVCDRAKINRLSQRHSSRSS